MSDSIDEPQDQAIPKNTENPTAPQAEGAEPELTENQKRAEFFINDFEKKLEEEKVKLAFTVLIDPESKQPVMYSKGSTYQLTRLLVDMARYFKGRLDQELKV